MSATNRGAERVENDNYPTPRWSIRRLLEGLADAGVQLPRGEWLEPCAGDGRIVEVVNSVIPVRNWSLVEIRDTAAQLRAIAPGAVVTAPKDYLKDLVGRVDVAITNPPFVIAEDVIKKALTEADWVVMLLRMNFLGSDGRANWLRNEMPDIYTLPDRPNFVASSKCKGEATRDVHGSDYQTRGSIGWKPAGCGWKTITSIEAPRFEECPNCGGKVQRSTSDSAEYGWFVWTPERGRRFGKTTILASTPEEERRAA